MKGLASNAVLGGKRDACFVGIGVVTISSAERMSTLIANVGESNGAGGRARQRCKTAERHAAINRENLRSVHRSGQGHAEDVHRR